MGEAVEEFDRLAPKIVRNMSPHHCERSEAIER
jgi:hypothetical protein